MSLRLKRFGNELDRLSREIEKHFPLTQQNAGFGLIGTGMVTMTAATTPDTGYLLCDGAAVSRTGATAALFARIGTAYGAGDGSTTFNLPDYRGRSPVGLGTHAEVDSLGESDGLSVGSRRPKHGHTVNDHAHSMSHTHGVVTAGPSASASAGTIPGFAASSIHTHGGVTGEPSSANTGGGTPGTDAQGPAYQVINFQIKL